MIILAQPQVSRIQATVRIAADVGGQWETVELRAEAEVSDPEFWQEEARTLLLNLKQEVGRFLQSRQQHTKQGDNGGTTGGNGRDVTAFWYAAYGAGLSRDEGLRLVAQAGGNFARARSLLPAAN